MKKLAKLLTLLFTLFVFQASTMSANSLEVEKFGLLTKSGDKLRQPIKVTFATSSPWKMTVRAIEPRISNLDKSSKTLPVTRLDISETSGLPLVNLDISRSYRLKQGNTTGQQSLDLYVNTLSYDGDYPGNYSVDLAFTIEQNNGNTEERIFTFRFNQPEVSSVQFDQANLNLSVSKDKVLKNCQENLRNPFSIYIKSNKDWKLYLIGRKNDEKNVLSYHYKVVGVSDSTVNYTNCGEYLPMKDTKMLIAEGKSTLNEASHQLMSKVINMDYLVKGANGGIIPSGSISADFEYILETEEN